MSAGPPSSSEVRTYMYSLEMVVAYGWSHVVGAWTPVWDVEALPTTKIPDTKRRTYSTAPQINLPWSSRARPSVSSPARPEPGP